MPALQVGSPEFILQSHQKEIKKKKNIYIYIYIYMKMSTSWDFHRSCISILHCPDPKGAGQYLQDTGRTCPKPGISGRPSG
jgi:hypothetical protein